MAVWARERGSGGGLPEAPKNSWCEAVAPKVRVWWAKRGTTLLLLATLCMVGASLWRLGNEFPRLLWELDGPGAVDLQLRHREVQRWFAGLSVYDEVERGDYPPASYAILWPLLGWLAVTPARWLWAVSTVAALGWLAFLVARESTARGRPQFFFVMMLVFSMYPASAAIRVGQLITLVLPTLVTGLVLLHRSRGRWYEDLLSSALLLPSLVKPTISVPFFWIVCFTPGRLRPIVLVSLGYVALTLFAVSFQEAGLFALLQEWLAEKYLPLEGHANIHKWLALFGLEAWMLPVSLLILAVLGFWTFQHREGDFWILLGVAALVARFWMHHRMYDDLLVLVAMIALFRLASQGPAPDNSDIVAGGLFGLTWLTLHAPAQVISLPPPWSALMEAAQSAVWLIVLAFLMRRARHDQSKSNLHPKAQTLF